MAEASEGNGWVNKMIKMADNQVESLNSRRIGITSLKENTRPVRHMK